MPAERSGTVIVEEVAEEAASPAVRDVVAGLRTAIGEGQPWFEALLDAIGQWRLPHEVAGEREYRYLIAGEAFDWLLLAERLLDEIPDLVPARDRDALLFDGQWPLDLDDEDFEERFGAAKYSAHLNFLYGVLVEQALQLSVEEEIHKENHSRAWGYDHRVDETMYQRVYGQSRATLLASFCLETDEPLGAQLSLGQWKAFVYWLFKFRLKFQDKARVASDTRKGLAQLSRMEHAVSQRRRGARLDEQGFSERFGG